MPPDTSIHRTEIADIAGLIVRLIHARRLDLSDEKIAQQQIAEILSETSRDCVREARLSSRDIPDFLLPESGLAIEVKLRSSTPAQILRQLTRYAGHERVQALLLITNRAMTLPPQIGGKAAFYASLGRGWL